MKKQDIAGIIVYVIILAFAAVFGLVVVRNYSYQTNMQSWQFILFVMGAIVAGLLFNATLYELAHVFGALLGGYKVTSVSVLGLTFLKDEGKFKIRIRSFDGLTGEVKIVPKENRKKPSNPLPYLIMGTALYAVEVVAVIFAFSILTREGSTTDMKNAAYFIIIMMAVGGMIVFYNIIPLQLDSMTDGYRLRLVSGKKNRDAFNNMLLGKTTVKDDKNESNEENAPAEETSFSSDIKLNEVLMCLNEEKYTEAEQLVDLILQAHKEEKKISQKTVLEAKADKIFLVFINNDLDTAIKYFEESLSLQDRKHLADESTLPCMRAYILVSALLDRSHSECVRTLDKVYKAYKRTPEERRNLESKLFNKALNLIIEKHPDWNLGEYLINVEK